MYQQIKNGFSYIVWSVLYFCVVRFISYEDAALAMFLLTSYKIDIAAFKWKFWFHTLIILYVMISTFGITGFKLSASEANPRNADEQLHKST